jgi:beta-mannosidase
MLVTLLPGQSKTFNVQCAAELDPKVLSNAPVFRCANQLVQ